MGDLYERRLADLFVKLSRVYGAHEPHPIDDSPFLRCEPCGVDWPWRIRVGSTTTEVKVCGGCGGPLVRSSHGMCGGERPSTYCDELGDAMWDLIDDAFPDDVDFMRRLLEDTPEAWLWGGSEAGGRGIGLVGYVADAFRDDAAVRLDLSKSCMPVDPAATEPSE